MARVDVLEACFERLDAFLPLLRTMVAEFVKEEVMDLAFKVELKLGC